MIRFLTYSYLQEPPAPNLPRLGPILTRRKLDVQVICAKCLADIPYPNATYTLPQGRLTASCHGAEIDVEIHYKVMEGLADTKGSALTLFTDTPEQYSCFPPPWSFVVEEEPGEPAKVD